ncbi:MAG: hypothetical protein ACD_64C00125G0003 [uncultured bacterium]|nr:MAG: hypothetical protein ACD_64C00125G0003 [uncultured bacterium]
MKSMRFFSLSVLFFIGVLCADAHKIIAPVSIGELFDKITILEIKMNYFTNPAQRVNVQQELTLLKQTVTDSQIIAPEITTQLEQLISQLRETNKKLWDIEDAIRAKEAKKEFDTAFIALARSVYFTNDERCRIKRAINELAGSTLIEEKQYTEYA